MLCIGPDHGHGRGEGGGLGQSQFELVEVPGKAVVRGGQLGGLEQLLDHLVLAPGAGVGGLVELEPFVEPDLHLLARDPDHAPADLEAAHPLKQKLEPPGSEAEVIQGLLLGQLAHLAEPLLHEVQQH
jgi:hypothetical protein